LNLLPCPHPVKDQTDQEQQDWKAGEQQLKHRQNPFFVVYQQNMFILQPYPCLYPKY
jgi:hypothetical protein